jgi:RNA polymerase sigma factor (sigma-70 family)
LIVTHKAVFVDRWDQIIDELWYRRFAHRQAVALEEAGEMLDDDKGQEPEPAFLRREEYALLRRRLANLPQQQQEILHLRFAGGLCSREIAELLNKREGTVRSMLARLQVELGLSDL